MGTAEGGWNESVEKVSKWEGAKAPLLLLEISMLEKCVGKICFMLEVPT